MSLTSAAARTSRSKTGCREIAITDALSCTLGAGPTRTSKWPPTPHLCAPTEPTTTAPPAPAHRANSAYRCSCSSFSRHRQNELYARHPPTSEPSIKHREPASRQPRGPPQPWHAVAAYADAQGGRVADHQATAVTWRGSARVVDGFHVADGVATLVVVRAGVLGVQHLFQLLRGAVVRIVHRAGVVGHRDRLRA